MSESAANWNCPRCGAEVDAGYEVCWACGTSRDGTPDPDFEVATAPIVEADHVDPPSPWAALLMVLFAPALAIYGLTKLAFPLEQRRLGAALKAAVVLALLAIVVFSLFTWLGGLLDAR